MHIGCFLDDNQLNRLFPFYILLDANLNIKSYGKSIKKIIDITIEKPFDDYFIIHTPEIKKLDLEHLSGKRCQLIVKETIESVSPLIIICELEYLSVTNELLLIGTPKIHADNNTKNDNEPKQETDYSTIISNKSKYETPENTAKGTAFRYDTISGVALTDANGSIEWVSKDFESSMGVKLADIIGMRPRNVIYGKGSTHISSSYVDEMVAKKKIFSFDNIGYNKRGESFWFRTTVQPILDAENNIKGRYYYFEDITPIKDKEYALKEVQDLWKFAVESTGDGIWSFDINKNKVTISDSLRDQIGLKRNEDLNENIIAQVLDPKDRNILRETISNLSTKEPTFSHEIKIRSANGKIKFYKARGKAYKWDEDKLSLLIGTLTDIDTEKRKDLKIKELAARTSTIISSLNYGILLENENREVVLANTKFCKLFDLPITPEQLIGMDCSGMADASKNAFKNPNEFLQRIDSLLEKQTEAIGDVLYMTDGRILERDYIPIFIEGKYQGHLWKYEDVTYQKKLEIGIKSSEARLISLIENLNLGILFEDQNREIIYTNKALYRFVDNNIATFSLVGNNSCTAIHKIKHIFKHPEEEVSIIDNAVSKNEIIKTRHIELADGKILKQQLIPVIVDDESKALLWVYEDITDQITTEQKLKAQKEYYHEILNSVPADIVIFSLDHKYQFINKNAVRNDEIRHWLIGKSDYDYCIRKNIDFLIADQRKEMFNKATSEKKPVSIIDEYLKPDKSVGYTLRIMYPKMDENGQLKYLIGYGNDITEQVLNERKAELNEKRVLNLLEFVKDGIFTCSKNGNLNYTNKSFWNIFIEAFPAINTLKPTNLFDLISKKEINKIKTCFDNLGNNSLMESCIIEAGIGHTIYLDFSVTQRLELETGDYICRITNITELIRKEENLKRMIEKEKELNASKSQFIRITSHELRTPLAVIQSNTEILELLLDESTDKSKILKAKPEKMINRILKEVKLMTETLNELMMISRIEAGKIEFLPETFNLIPFIESIISDLYLPYSDGRNARIICKNDNVMIYGDIKLLRHAIENLLNNAFKYSMGSNPPEVIVDYDEKDIVISIIDFGIGIPETDQKKLFHSFFRASNVKNIQGSGLGLMVVDYCIKKHNGKVHFNSKQGIGTTFTLTIPKKS